MPCREMKIESSQIPPEYQRGYTKFLNCQIDLSKKTFIPRIETEFWVKKALKELSWLENKRKNNKTQFLKGLDIFAGSGCIGIAILTNIKNSRVDFVDIDKKAIEQIKINLKLNNISKKRYRVIQSDLFKKLKKKKYDFIFANPPYVAKERIKEVQVSVLKFEPQRAILAGKKGLFYIRRFLKGAKNFLKKEGIIYMEFDPRQKTEIKKNLEKFGYKKFKFLPDQFQKYRWLKIQK